MLSSHVFPLISLAILFAISVSASSSNDPILYDIKPFVTVYKNGTVERYFGLDVLPASIDPATGVHSRDVKFAKRSNLSARIYLPKGGAGGGRKLPLLIYFHGGGFFAESAFSPTYHHHLNTLVAAAKVIAVSVNYRLAPEHPLPIAYEDSWRALQWTFSHFRGNGREPWLKKYADFTRFYMGGDSAGANIAHHLAIRIGSENPSPGTNFQGMFLNCPFFLGKKLISNESSPSHAYQLTMDQKLWVYAYPNSSGLDDPLVNPEMDPRLKMVGCKRVVVYVAGNDVLKYRGWYYKEALEKSGWNGEVKVVEFVGEDHDFVLVDPTRKDAVVMIKELAYFLNH